MVMSMPDKENSAQNLAASLFPNSVQGAGCDLENPSRPATHISLEDLLFPYVFVCPLGHNAAIC